MWECVREKKIMKQKQKPEKVLFLTHLFTLFSSRSWVVPYKQAHKDSGKKIFFLFLCRKKILSSFCLLFAPLLSRWWFSSLLLNFKCVNKILNVSKDVILLRIERINWIWDCFVILFMNLRAIFRGRHYCFHTIWRTGKLLENFKFLRLWCWTLKLSSEF